MEKSKTEQRIGWLHIYLSDHANWMIYCLQHQQRFISHLEQNVPPQLWAWKLASQNGLTFAGTITYCMFDNHVHIWKSHFQTVLDPQILHFHYVTVVCASKCLNSRKRCHIVLPLCAVSLPVVSCLGHNKNVHAFSLPQCVFRTKFHCFAQKKGKERKKKGW